ncbi:hypothetical protein BGW80DRAFT_97016 [Lactifluus volemus]|nr:hypothetical protein BGW80DRAFT_97016 [Lactifluus volemus]
MNSKEAIILFNRVEGACHVSAKCGIIEDVLPYINTYLFITHLSFNFPRPPMSNAPWPPQETAAHCSCPLLGLVYHRRLRRSECPDKVQPGTNRCSRRGSLWRDYSFRHRRYICDRCHRHNRLRDYSPPRSNFHFSHGSLATVCHWLPEDPRGNFQLLQHNPS